MIINLLIISMLTHLKFYKVTTSTLLRLCITSFSTKTSGIHIIGDISKLDDKINTIANSISITEKCTERIKSVLKVSTDKKFLRLMVEGGGCSGYQYIFKMDETINSDEDLVFEKDDSKVVIDKLSLPFLEGAIIDYKDSLIKSSFTISENPKAEISCSCGSSFAPKLI